MYRIKYWFEHGGGCLWPDDVITTKKHGCPIAYNELPLSSETIFKLVELEKEYHSYLDWNAPSNPSPWSENHKRDFLLRAQKLCYILQKELGSEYNIADHVSDSLQ